MIVTKNKVFWSKTTDSHEDIIAEFGLTEIVRNAVTFVRVEIIPPEDRFEAPRADWHWCVDQDVLPAWWDAKDAENRCRIELKNWIRAKVRRSGKHTAKDGFVYLCCTAQGEFYGTAQATLFDNAKATLHGNAKAILFNNAQATLDGTARATLHDNAQATLHGNAKAILFNNAQATLHDNAQGELYDTAQATLHDNAQGELYGTAQATLLDNAQATLLDNAKATLYDTAQAELYGTAQAELLGQAKVTADQNSTVIKRSIAASVRLKGKCSIMIDRTDKIPVCTIGK